MTALHRRYAATPWGRIGRRSFAFGIGASGCIVTGGLLARDPRLLVLALGGGLFIAAALANPLYSVFGVIVLSGVGVAFVANQPVTVAGVDINAWLALTLIGGVFVRCLVSGAIPLRMRVVIPVALGALVILPPVGRVVDLAAGARLIVEAVLPFLLFLVVRYGPFGLDSQALANAGRRALIASLAVAGAATVAVALQGRGLWSAAEGGAPRFAGSLGAGLMAFFLLTPFCVALAALMAQLTRRRLVAFTAIAAALAATLTRSALLSAAVVTGVIAIGGRKMQHVLMIVGVYVAIAISVLSFAPAAANRFQSGIGVPESQVLGTLTGRQMLWNYIWDTDVQPSPWRGAGLGATKAIFRGETGFKTGAGAVHNDYLWILAETGVTGLLLYAVGLVAVGRAIVRRRNRAEGPSLEVVRHAALAALIGFAIVSSLDNAIGDFSHVGVLVFALAGLAARSGSALKSYGRSVGSS